MERIRRARQASGVIQLRDYQARAIAQIRESYGPLRKRAPLFVLPTGGGKSIVMAFIAHGAAAKGNRVYILSHRTELIDQLSAALNATNTPHGFIAAGYGRISAPTQIASVATLIRRIDKIAAPDLLLIDEAHHARAGQWTAIIQRWQSAKVLGVTATPIRLSGEGLAEIFDHLVIGPTTAELMAAGFLARYRLFSPPTVDTSGLHRRAGEFVTAEADELVNKPAITGCALQHYEAHANGLPALAFCVSIQHARDVAEQFRAAGHSALSIDGSMERTVRRGIVDDFRAGKISVITSCEVLNEGFDVPGAHVGIFLRPTQSLGLYLQQIGRILRPCEGKSHAILLDHVGNSQRFGLPDEARDWQLTYDEEHRAGKKPASVRVCAQCFCALPAGTPQCPECGYEFPAKPRIVEERGGSLVELTPEQIAAQAAKRHARQEQGRASSLEALREIERRKGYRSGWADHVYAARQRKRQHA